MARRPIQGLELGLETGRLAPQNLTQKNLTMILGLALSVEMPTTLG